MTTFTIKEKLIGNDQSGQRAQTFYAFELLRFLCAFLIVWGHIGAPLPQMGYFGLNVFVILNVALSTRAAIRHPLQSFLSRRVTRIFLPWLGWSAFYLFFRGLRDGWDTMFQLTDPLWLLIGPEIHLWYLPFVLLSAPLAYATMHLPNGRVFGGILVLLTVPLCCAVYYVERTHMLPAPFAQWCFAIPPLAYAITRVSGRRYGPVFILAGTLAGMSVLGHPEPVLYLILAALTFEVFIHLEKIGRWAKPLGDAAFGIYLLHPLFVVILTRFIDFETQKATLADAVFLASWASSFILLQFGHALKKQYFERFAH